MRLLYITSLSGKRINRFMRSAIVAARQMGIEFDMACNMANADSELYKKDCDKYGIRVFNIPFARNPLSPKNIKAYKELNKLFKANYYDAVHCNTPIGGLLGRFCAKKNHIKTIIYQAHGFHFWSGAPIKNWLFYYPVEKKMAKATDYYLTINREDYERSKKFTLRKNGEFVLIHGVGIDRIGLISEIEKEKIRAEFNLPENSKIIISVGELNKNKNHQLLIKAISNIHDSQIYCLICGEGKERESLQKLIDSKGLSDNVKLLGFRSDVDKLLQISSMFVFPSFREGLPISLMEAIECSIPCSASRIRGVVDLLPSSELLFSPNNVDELVDALKKINDVEFLANEVKLNSQTIKPFEFDNVVAELMGVYKKAFTTKE